MWVVYSLLYAIVLAFLFIPQYLKRPPELRGRWLREKLGNIGYSPAGDRPIWVHAVSVGEVSASILLLKKIRAAYPGKRIILSTITDTGQKIAGAKAPAGTQVVYLPFDLLFILRRCIVRTDPCMMIIIETELWPNLFRACSSQGIPILLLNGRISGKSGRGYRRISFFMKEALRNISAFGMQGDIDAERLLAMGADQGKMKVLGNFKFDMDAPGSIPEWALAIRGPVIVAGSTFNGEEELIVSAWKENLAKFPSLTLILAPRHPERFKDVEGMLAANRAPYVKRSSLTGPVEHRENGVILLDSIGELTVIYGVADIAIMGKSFRGTGGQNPLEPAYWGKAIICGPHMENFPFIRDFYAGDAAFEVEEAGLAKKIRELLVSPEKAKAAGEKARELYLRNSGAVDRAMGIIREFLP